MTDENADSPWAPLRRPIYRTLWLADLAGNLGTWMQNMGATWLMTSLSSEPVMISLVQVATSVPMFLLALPAGALADLFDRRRLLIGTQLWMLAAAGALGIATLAGVTTPWLLLSLTAALAAGAAISAPADLAVIRELVPKSELARALSLDSAGYNLARAVGPAIAGLIVAKSGPGAVFLLNAVSFVATAWALYRWKPQRKASTMPMERIGGAMRAGLRYVRHAPDLRRVISRTILFAIPASALWALLPLIAKDRLHAGALTFGALLGALGIGAIAGTWLLPRLLRKYSAETLAFWAALAFASAAAAGALSGYLIFDLVFMAAGGMGWLILVVQLRSAVQALVPAWVQARAAGFFMLAFQGALAAGSILWGWIAGVAGAPAALLLSVVALTGGALIGRRHALHLDESLNLAPVDAWPAPVLHDDLSASDGPVLVTIEYRVAEGMGETFGRAMQTIGLVRRRDGAYRWGLFVDATDPSRYVEEFLVESWMEHLRQHARMTVVDWEGQLLLREFLTEQPRVSHLLTPRVEQFAGD